MKWNLIVEQDDPFTPPTHDYQDVLDWTDRVYEQISLIQGIINERKARISKLIVSKYPTHGFLPVTSHNSLLDYEEVEPNVWLYQTLVPYAKDPLIQTGIKLTKKKTISL